MITNKLTLSFSGDEEKTYQAYLFQDSLNIVRISFVLVTILYALFGILDTVVIPETKNFFFLIRYGIVIPFLVLVIILSFFRFFRKIWKLLLFASFLIGGSGILAMLVRVPDNLTYYAGLMLIFSAGYFFIKLPFFMASIAGWSLLLLFDITMLWFTDVSSMVMLAYNFFYVSANVICMVGAYYIESTYRRNYILNNQLDHKKLELEESNRNLESEVWKRTQELIRAKERAEESDRLKSAFLANMSHEIRTPMNGILGFADLLKEPGLAGEEQQKYIRIIEKGGERMLNIIQDIIDISKIESGQMKVQLSETNINEQVEFIYAFFKPEAELKGLKISSNNALPSNEAFIITDREKLYAILTNLVKNAIKFCNAGSIEFGYVIQGEYLEFYVEDSGPGISPDRQAAIFERFIQANNSTRQVSQGAGLGLSISKAFVTLLGGQIWLESEKGVGSVFYFTIPYHPVNRAPGQS